MKRQSLIQKMRVFDIFPKFSEEVVEQNSIGGVVSLIGLLVVFFLLISEVGEYMSPGTDDVLYVYHNRGEKMNINLRILFLSLPCDMVSLDVSDQLGEEQTGVNRGKNSQILEIDWSGNFQEIYSTFRKRHPKVDPLTEIKLWTMLRAAVASSATQCLPCYEAQISGTQCCNHCYHLIKAFLAKGLNPHEAFKHPQCSDNPPITGCMMSGIVNVNKVQGSFHIAAGETHTDYGSLHHHHHWEDIYRRAHFNVSHYINQFSFGKEFPDLVNPLNGHLSIDNKLGQQQYFLQVVPTNYIKGNGRIIDSNQYSVTMHYNVIEDVTAEHVELPGIFFKYDISPIAINLYEKYTSFGHFITRVFAVVGGMWVVIGLIYSLLRALFGEIVKAKKSS